MKKVFKRMLSWVLSVMMVVGIVSVMPNDVRATQSSSGGFNTGYSLTGDGFTDMVNIAMAQNERTQAQIGYSESWCADFVSDCARLAGQEGAIPFNGVVQSMYNAVIAAGGYVVGSAQAGDLVFFTNGSGYGHVGIALDGSRNISGNIWYNGNPPSKVCILNNSWEGFRSWTYVRPNYKKADTTAPTISDIYTHSFSSDGYYLHFIVHDDKALSYVRVYTQGSVPQKSEDIAVSGTGWELNYRVNYSDYGNVKSGYTHAIWVFDTAGNRGDSDWIYVNSDTEKPSITNLTVSQVTSKGYRVTCNVNDNVGISSVSFPTWTPWNNGQDDLIWHEATVNGDGAFLYINTSDHNNETGTYTTDVYVYDTSGNCTTSRVSVDVSDNPIEVSSMVYGTHKYTVFNSGLSWIQAKQWCENNGGYLACTTDESEWNAVKGLLEKYNGVRCWLGAESTSGSWKWITDEPVEFSVWADGQPDNAGGKEHYLGTFGAGILKNYKWNDFVDSPRVDDYVGGFVMEKEIVPTATAEFNGNKYEYYSDTMSWWQAYRFCEKKGGHLVTINSKEENDFVVGMTTGKNYGVWTGGKTDSSHEVWHWITGEPFEYQNWDDGEPNNVKQDAVQLYITDTHIGKWDDLASTDTTNCGFICEYDNSIDASKYEPVYKENYNGHEYWFFEDIVDWHTAKKICEAKGGYLVIIDNKNENDMVYSGIQKISKSQAWIGATDITEEGIWRDSKGNVLKYTNWHPVQPDNWNGNVEEDYAVIWPEGYWNDCGSFSAVMNNIGFVCEFDDLCTGSGHSYTTKVVEPTCTEQGYTLHTCERCGDSYKDDVTNKLSHKFGEWSVTGDKAVHKCTLCGAEETKPLASSVTLDKTSVSIEKGKNITLKAIISPDDAFDKTVTWSSTNSNVATVSDGVVTAKSAGTAVIIAITSNGKSAICTVTVNNSVSSLRNTSVISSDIYQVGDKVRIAPSANGGSGGYSSAVYYKRSTASTWKLLGKEFGNTFKQSSSTVAFQPISAGTFDIKVVIKDTDGSAAEQFFTVEVVDELELTNISIVGRYVVKLGTAIPMIGKAVGGAGSYTYSFYFKRSTNTNWKLLGEKYQTAASARFKPTATGTYDIRIDVKDSSGKIVKKFFTATAR